MMTDPREYKVSDDILAAHLEGEAVLLNMETKNYYRLNETAAVVYKGLERGLDREGLVDELCGKFDVQRDEAAEAVDALMADLAARGLAAPASE